jgi:hypothetical protein
MNVRKKLSNQQGAVAILVACSLIAFLGCAALVIDIGFALVANN